AGPPRSSTRPPSSRCPQPKPCCTARSKHRPYRPMPALWRWLPTELLSEVAGIVAFSRLAYIHSCASAGIVLVVVSSGLWSRANLDAGSLILSMLELALGLRLVEAERIQFGDLMQKAFLRRCGNDCPAIAKEDRLAKLLVPLAIGQ